VRLLPAPIRRVVAQWARKALDLRPIDGAARAWTTVLESFAGAWQQDVTIDRIEVSKNTTFFACITLRANDIGKMGAKLMRLIDGI